MTRPARSFSWCAARSTSPLPAVAAARSVEGDPGQAGTAGAATGTAATAAAWHGAEPGSRRAAMERLVLIAVSLMLLLTACGGGGNANAGPDAGGGFYCPHNAFEGCANP
jgi:hypothetical protein